MAMLARSTYYSYSKMTMSLNSPTEVVLAETEQPYGRPESLHASCIVVLYSRAFIKDLVEDYVTYDRATPCYTACTRESHVET